MNSSTFETSLKTETLQRHPGFLGVQYTGIFQNQVYCIFLLRHGYLVTTNFSILGIKYTMLIFSNFRVY